MKSHKLRIILIIALIIIILVAGYLIKKYHNIEIAHARPASSARVVPFALTKSVTWQHRVAAIGTVSTQYGVTLKAEIAGRITKIYQAAGTHVQKGAPLFQVYPKTLQAEKAALIAQVKLDQYKLNRLQTLYKESAVSQEAYEIAKDTLSRDQANLNKVRSQLSLTIVRAPLNGTVGLHQVNVGDYVSAGQTLATFQPKQFFRIVFSIPERFATRVKNGQRITFTPGWQTKKIGRGVVYAINAEVSPKTRMLTLWARINNHTIPALMPGMFVNVELYIGKPYPVIIVPQLAVLQSPYGSYVYIVHDGKAQKILVQTGQRRGKNIAILSGLKAGQTVISGGQVQIYDGTAVTDKGAVPLPTQAHQ